MIDAKQTRVMMSDAKIILLSYAVQAYYQDGRKGVCCTFGSKATAENEASRLLSECGYARTEIETWEGCSDCKGHGRHPKRKGKKIIPFAYKTCNTCNGLGCWRRDNV